MARKSKGPWFWELRQEYVVNVHGQRYYLGPDREKAYQKWHQLAGAPAKKTTGEFSIFGEFLKWCKKNKPASHDWYETRINSFKAFVGELDFDDLKPHHVDDWLDTKKSDGYKRGCAIAVKRALNWAVKQGHVNHNPIKMLELPAAGERDIVLSQAEFDEILSYATDQNWKDLLNFVWETGCRPQEARKLEARHLDLDQNRCVFPKKESKGKKKARVIYLTPKARAIVEGRQGRIFRNATGKPWTANNIACRFVRLKKKIGRQLCLYNLRHSYCQRALKRGIDPVTLAELMGHASANMIFKVYQHLRQDVQHMQAAAVKAVS